MAGYVGRYAWIRLVLMANVLAMSLTPSRSPSQPFRSRGRRLAFGWCRRSIRRLAVGSQGPLDRWRIICAGWRGHSSHTWSLLSYVL